MLRNASDTKELDGVFNMNIRIAITAARAVNLWFYHILLSLICYYCLFIHHPSCFAPSGVTRYCLSPSGPYFGVLEKNDDDLIIINTTNNWTIQWRKHNLCNNKEKQNQKVHVHLSMICLKWWTQKSRPPAGAVTRPYSIQMVPNAQSFSFLSPNSRGHLEPRPHKHEFSNRITQE